jgi:hypothetical protein
VHIHLRLAAQGEDSQTCDVCAIYRKVAVLGEQGTKTDDPRAAPGGEKGPDFLRVASDEASMNGVVPVVACHLVESGQKVIRGVRSAVWLQALDECDGGYLDASQLASLRFSDERLRVAESLRADGLLADREAVSPSRLLMVRLDKRPDQVFEGRPALVKALPDEDAEPGRHRPTLLDVCGVPAGLEVDLKPHDQGFVTLPLLALRLEGAQMFVRTVDFGPDRD